jgi:hypothetical protein
MVTPLRCFVLASKVSGSLMHRIMFSTHASSLGRRIPEKGRAQGGRSLHTSLFSGASYQLCEQYQLLQITVGKFLVDDCIFHP